MALNPENRVGGSRLWLFALALWLLVSTVSLLAVFNLRRDATEAQQRELDRFSQNLTDQVGAVLDRVEHGLRAIRDEVADGRMPLAGADAERILKLETRTIPSVRALWLVDPLGRTLSASGGMAAPATALFAALPGQPGGPVAALSRPFDDPQDHQRLFALALPLDGTPAAPGGWVVAALPCASLSPVAGEGIGAAVLRDDGVLLAGSLPSSSATGDERTTARLAAQTVPGLIDQPDRSRHPVQSRALPPYGLTIVLHRDGGTTPAAWRATVSGTAAGLAALLIAMTLAIRHVNRLERRLLAAERALRRRLARDGKLESLGRLAGGVAHDFNNVLAAILGYGEMARDAAAPRSDQARHLDSVIHAALRGKALAERILAFSRGVVPPTSVFELGPIVEQSLSLLAGSFDHGVTLERQLDEPSARVRGDPTLAFEATLNLCANALQAMAGRGGKLTVRLSPVHVPGPRVLSHGQVAGGDYIVLTVADEGPGIGREAMERLFEPFFTTREATGTGLGLAVVQGAVAELGGAIDVRSAPGRGSQFSLYFPQCSDAVSPLEASPRDPPRGRGQRIMVIDDEPALVALLNESLAGLGYMPLGYSDPKVALDDFNREPWCYAAVVIDEVMPQLSGTALLAELRKRAPDVPALLVSGDGGALLARTAESDVTRVLRKPLERAALAQALSEVLR